MFDERFLLVALMLLFIVVPMLMSFLYTYYMLTPEARRAVLRKEVEISEGESLRLIYLPPEESENERRKRTKRIELPVGGSREEEKPLPPLPLPVPETIRWEDVIGVKYTARFIVYLINGPRLNFILIPHSAIPREAIV